MTINDKAKLSKIEEEIKKMEEKAKKAKARGLNATYSNYRLNISLLKDQLQKLRTQPNDANT